MTTKEQELEIVRKFMDKYDCQTIINNYIPYTLYKLSDIAIIAGIIDIDSVIWKYDSTEQQEYWGSQGDAIFLTYKGLCRLASSTNFLTTSNSCSLVVIDYLSNCAYNFFCLIISIL